MSKIVTSNPPVISKDQSTDWFFRIFWWGFLLLLFLVFIGDQMSRNPVITEGMAILVMTIIPLTFLFYLVGTPRETCHRFLPIVFWGAVISLFITPILLWQMQRFLSSIHSPMSAYHYAVMFVFMAGWCPLGLHLGSRLFGKIFRRRFSKLKRASSLLIDGFTHVVNPKYSSNVRTIVLAFSLGTLATILIGSIIDSIVNSQHLTREVAFPVGLSIPKTIVWFVFVGAFGLISPWLSAHQYFWHRYWVVVGILALSWIAHCFFPGWKIVTVALGYTTLGLTFGFGSYWFGKEYFIPGTR